jgi:hypothetical protein
MLENISIHRKKAQQRGGESKFVDEVCTSTVVE